MARRGPSRPQQWAAAASDARKALDAIEAAVGEYQDAMSVLRDLQAEYQDWRDNLPESFSGTALGEKLEAVADMDLEPGDDDLDAMRTAVDEAEGADLPLGFGKD